VHAQQAVAIVGLDGPGIDRLAGENGNGPSGPKPIHAR